MKKKFFRLSATLLVMVLFLVLIAPAMAGEKRTEFHCSEVVQAPPVGGEVKTLPNGSIHVRSATLLATETADDTRLNGLNTILLNANLNADRDGPMWGTFRIDSGETAGSGWEGTYAGRSGEFYHAVGDGFGAYAGMKMWWYKFGPAEDDCRGFIVEH